MDQEDRIECLRAALGEIAQWARAYPVAVFPEPTSEDCHKAHELLKTIGLTLDQFAAHAMRHVITQVGEIADEALRAT